MMLFRRRATHSPRPSVPAAGMGPLPLVDARLAIAARLSRQPQVGRAAHHVDVERALCATVDEGLVPELETEQAPKSGAVILLFAQVFLQHGRNVARIEKTTLAKAMASQGFDHEVANLKPHPVLHRNREALFAAVEDFRRQ